MKNQDISERGESRVSIIKNIRTVLGFFALVLLVVEGILTINISLTTGEDRTLLIKGMLAIIVVLIIVVAFIAFLKPQNLVNQPDIGPHLGITPNINSNIEGMYYAGIDRKYKVIISRLTGDYYRVYNPDDWEGVGFFDGEFYYGVFKLNDQATPPERRGNWGAHRSRLPLGKKSPFEVVVIEANNDNKICGVSHEVEGWNKNS